MYDPWIHWSLTKLQMLRLVGYKSVLFLDADTLVLRSPDELFEVPPPAGICSSRVLLKDRALDVMLHADPLPDSFVEQAILTSYGIRGGLLLLAPEEATWMAAHDALEGLESIGDNDLIVGEGGGLGW